MDHRGIAVRSPAAAADPAVDDRLHGEDGRPGLDLNPAEFGLKPSGLRIPKSMTIRLCRRHLVAS
jgi:hypothetical protein